VEGTCHFAVTSDPENGRLAPAARHGAEPPLHHARSATNKRLNRYEVLGSPAWSRNLARPFLSPPTPSQGKSAARSAQALARQVLVYCFRWRNCGTFMPLSRVRGQSRIAVVWTWFSAVFSVVSSGHFRVLFTGSVVLSVGRCG
jgi:hypothetical protein